MTEVLAMFINEFDEETMFANPDGLTHNINKKVLNLERMKEIVRDYTDIISSEDVENKSPRLNTNTYQKHLLLSK